MPEMTGIELYHEICSRWPALGGRFLFVTGSLGNPDVSRFADGPRERFVEQPFDQELLLGRILELTGHQAGAGDAPV